MRRIGGLFAGLLSGALFLASPAGAQQSQCVSNALAGGTVDAIRIPLQPCALSTNVLILTLAGANTIAQPTLQMAGYPVQNIYTSTGTAPGVGALPGAGATVMLTSTGTSWKIVSGNAPSFTGTLTVPNGGTGATTLTSNGVLLGHGTSAVTGTVAGTTGQVLAGNTGSAPTFQALSGLGVTTVGFGTTGLTPSAATAGAVTVAGTLAVTNGGTGQTAYTDGQLLIGNTGTGGLSKAALTAGANTVITNGSGTITIASTGVSSGCGTIGTTGQMLTDNGSGGCSSSAVASIAAGTFTLASGGAAITGTTTNTGTLNGTLQIRSGSATAIPAGGATTFGHTGTSTTNFGQFFGSGAPTLSVAQGSLYLRSDGLPYYNTNGTTGWDQLDGLANVSTSTGTKTFSGTSATLAAKLANAAEPATISATAATGTIAYDVCTQSVLYYTSSAAANWTLNLRCSSGTSLNTAMATGDVVTVVFMVTQGASPFYNNVLQVDGSGVTPKCQGSACPAAGNASGVDVYTYAIVKTGSAAFTVFESQTQFK